VLYDRNNMIDQINAGTLTFSDGSSIPVSALDNSGLGEAIAFTPRTVTWVKFQVTSGAGLNVGLSEFEAFSSTTTATATASSSCTRSAGNSTSSPGAPTDRWRPPGATPPPRAPG
jgi:hypothetical protein